MITLYKDPNGRLVTGDGVVLNDTTVGGLIAAGSSRADAVQLRASINRFSTVAASTGCILPVASIGCRAVTIINGGANALTIYGSGSDTIDGVAGATGVSLAAGATQRFECSANGAWTISGVGAKALALDSPVLTTPNIGVATATSVNKMAITAPATSSTLAVADGKTLTANNTLTLAGTDATTMTFPSTSASVARIDAAQSFTGVQTFANVTFGAGGVLNADNGTATAVAGAATLSKMAGVVTSEALTTAANADYTLTLTNTLITAASNLLVTVGYGTATTGHPNLRKVTPGAGSAAIVIHNDDTAIALNGTIIIQFLLVKP